MGGHWVVPYVAVVVHHGLLYTKLVLLQSLPLPFTDIMQILDVKL